ncbi:MAG: hypothetical protein AB1483_08510 [Candidatus Zixiibacteriota bacterium]
MNRLKVILTAVIVLILASQASAFDGKRKGVVLGLGLGFSPWVHGSLDDPEEESAQGGFAGNVIAGYALSEKDVVLVVHDGVFYTETIYREALDGSLSKTRDTDYQGFRGIGYRRYMDPAGRSLFVTAALGEQRASKEETGFISGFGLLVGGGIEFTKHLEFYASYAAGTASHDAHDYTFSQFMLSFTGVIY